MTILDAIDSGAYDAWTLSAGLLFAAALLVVIFEGGDI